jgi:type IV pilus assembly protein PilV
MQTFTAPPNPSLSQLDIGRLKRAHHITRGSSMHVKLQSPSQRGVSLIESLVAIVVMALGILGILGVQMRTLTDTQTGVRRAQAIRLIEDLAERLQNNPDALNNLSTYTTEPASQTNCTASACTPADLAKSDIWQWRTNVTNALPGAQATVFIPKGGARQLGVLIGWRENQYNQDGKAVTASDATAAMKAPFVVSGTKADDSAVSCNDGLICHLQYVQPTQRCSPWSLGGGTLYCPN